ncbi:MAG: thiamine phosphate synthase [Rhizomicrobium sp.]|nr:thiamine phosphate synthase [Rhizomicrobium sp.]
MSDSASRRNFARAAAKLAATAGAELPALILMTDDERLADPLAAARALPRGAMVILRAREAAKRRNLALALREVARARGLFQLIASDIALARQIGADGVHLPEARLGEAAAIRAQTSLIITASAHSLAALRKADAVDALILSVVFASQSHPDGASLGPLRAAAMARLCPLPVYALGGITAKNAGRLASFCGIAAIGALKA